MVDSKPLLQDRPPAYNAVPGAYEYGPQPQQGYGAIPPAAPPPYPYPDGQGNENNEEVTLSSDEVSFLVIARNFLFAQPHVMLLWVTLQLTGITGFPPAQMGPAVSQQPYAGTYTIIQPSVVVVGGCPACRVGVLEDDFTCLGILCAIFFFPLGILFCFALRQRRCPNCGATNLRLEGPNPSSCTC
ncbi:hypothetical protein L3Q82_014250, partial [Scortum barcoo]